MAGAVNVKPGGMGTLPYLTLPYLTLPYMCMYMLHVTCCTIHVHVHVTCYMLYDVELESALA